jgi:hypothetical protein
VGLLNVHLEVMTQPGSTGNQTINVGTGFAPKAVRAWAIPATADGSVARASQSVGFGTYRGGSVQQGYATTITRDASVNADASYAANTNALLALIISTGGSSTLDFQMELVSMDDDEVVVNFSNLHSTASFRIFLLILGGDAISDAVVFNDTMPTGSTNHDVALPSGFGRPEFIEACGSGGTAFGGTASTPKWWYGFAKQGESGRGLGYSVLDGNTNVFVAARQRSDRFLNQIIAGDPTSSDEALGQLDTTVGNWPTDGFRIVYDANPAAASKFVGLALRTTAQIATGANDAVTAGSPPVDQDNDCGFAPKLGSLLGWNLAASASLDESSADLVGFGIGSYDGTTAAWCGITDDDGVGTSDANGQQVVGKVIRNYSPAAALQSEADASFSGNNFRLSWGDIDSVARQYQWFAFGDPPLASESATVTLPVEASQGVAAPAALPYEALAALSATISLPFESEVLSTLAPLPVETTQAVSASVTLPVETTKVDSAAAALSFEATKGERPTAVLPVETPQNLRALGTTTVEAPSVIPIDTILVDAPVLADLTLDGGDVILSWDEVSQNVDGYIIYRGTAPGQETMLTSVGVTLSYTDVAVPVGAIYYYRVSAFNSYDESPLSNELSIFLGPNTEWDAPDGLADSYYAVLPWHDAQRKFAETGPTGVVLRADARWHGTRLDTNRGAVAIANAAGPLAPYVGKRIRLTSLAPTGRPRTIYLYLSGSTTKITEDLSLSRRAFLGLGVPALTNTPVKVEVLA